MQYMSCCLSNESLERPARCHLSDESVLSIFSIAGNDV